jgi:DNA-binding Lrp family transcriptional regulator
MVQMKFRAFILMNVNLGCENDVLKALKKVQGFDEAFYVLGDYDIIAKVTANTFNEINQIVSHVRKLANVRTTATMIAREL